MTAIAVRLDPCVNWFKLLARTKGRILWAFPLLLLAGYLIALSAGNPIGGFFERRAESREHAALLSEARALNLDYETVLARPQVYLGKPVLWCIDRPSSDLSYVSGRPAWPVALSGPYEYVGGRCRDTLAVITGSESGLIRLRPVERF
jgi:hypothetical protein